MINSPSWRVITVGAIAAVLLCGMGARTAAGQVTTTYGYDPHGRLLSVTSSNGNSTTYVYDAAGNRTRVTSTSSAPDTTPDPLYLGGPITEATASTWYVSSNRAIAGINVAVPVTISGGEYRINGTAWQTTAGSISAGENFQVRVRALSTPGATRTATVTVGGLTDTFQVITENPDTTPDPLYLGGPITGATAGTWYASSNRAIAGINVAVPVTISGGEYRINGTAWQTTTGSISAGENFQVRVRALATAGATRTATVTVGSLTDTFQVTTAD